MVMVRKGARCLTFSVCLVALAACSGGGGGGGSPNTTATNSTSNNTTSNSTPPSVTITAPDNPSSGGTAYTSYNFTTNLPPAGTSFGLAGTIVKVTSTSIGGSGLMGAQRAFDTATYQGNFTSNGVTYPIINLSVPSLGFTANNVRGDGTATATSNGGSVSAAVATLNYTVLGAWSYTVPGGGTAYLGQSASGFLTPNSGIPTSGSATYIGNSSTTGGAIGAYAVNTSNGVQAGTLAGNVSVTANFGPNTISGTMTNMTATPTGSGTSTPWNNVTLTGTISNPSLSLNNAFGTTAASAAPTGAGAAAFTTAAQGTFAGSFFGPNAQEFGATWTLYESTNGGKAAFGTIGATATTP
jgi:C-lobe and N-lobe beta barrels of Tf-binding protein B